MAGCKPRNPPLHLAPVPLPQTIPVKYTEEDAECLSVRPVVRQTFRLHELLDMILCVTGKDPARVQKVLRGGTVVFHFYRYRWEGFAAPEAEFAEELATALALFPDSDRARPFRSEECTAVALETGSHTPPEWKKEEVSRRRLLRRKSFWAALMELAAGAELQYVKYSYDRKGDVYAMPVGAVQKQSVAECAKRLLPDSLRGPLAALPRVQRLLLLCPRK